MPEVNVEIDGKKYRMACEEGQEAHLMELAERFNRTVIGLKGSFGEIGDNRLVVMAGIAEKNGHPIGFWQFAKYGVPVTLVSILLCVPYLWLRYFVFA